ncbi:MAG TPA: XrtA system polysaccharide chain length determinant [Gemmatimonadaceae bacterium]|nr:XrtA system polysaccharide chain length determinant [Gemmatimonadaceae bacterium]
MNPEQIAKTLVNESFHSRRLFVALFVIVNLAALAAGFVWPKTYTSSTSILVDDKNVIQPLMLGAAVATDVADRGKNAREVIFSRKIMGGVLERGGWMKDRPSAVEQDRLIEDIKKRTMVSNTPPGGGKAIINIDYRDDQQQRAYLATKAFAELFIAEVVAEKKTEILAAFEFIDKQAQEYQQKLTIAEGELRQLRASNTSARPGGEVELSARLIALNTRIENTTLELREAEMKRASLERQVSGEAQVTVLATRDGEFRARIAELQAKLDTLRLTFYDTYPDIVQLKNQIKDLRTEAGAQRERREKASPSERTDPDETVVNNPVYQQLRKELSQNQLTIDALKSRIAEAQRLLQEEANRSKDPNGGDARLAELTRDYQINRDIYQDLLRRRERARVSMNLDADSLGLTLKILEPAVPAPRASGPRFWHFVLGGLALGILVPLGLLYSRIQFDPRVRVASAISQRHSVPVAAIVPHLWSPEALIGLRRELVILTLLVTATVALSATLSVVRLLGAL